MLSPTFYQNADKSYREAILSLENNMGHNNSNEKLLKDFADNYMLPEELWEKADHREGQVCYQMFYHFFFHKNIFDYGKLRNKLKLLYSKEYSVPYTDYLCFPHSRLNETLNEIEERLSGPLTNTLKKEFLRNKKLFNSIKLADDDDEKWITAMKETDDKIFVQQNIEYRLGEDLTNKNLWKLYIEYLKDTDSHVLLLHTYSKYCRFWLDDVEMKEEYRKAAKIYGPIEVPWKNTYDFEIYDENAIKKYLKTVPRRPREILYVNASNETCYYQYKSDGNVVRPEFCFRPTFIRYIWDNSNGDIRWKLYNTCKYFFDKHPTPICYSLRMQDNRDSSAPNKIMHTELNYVFYGRDPADIRVKNLHVTTNVMVLHDSNALVLANVIPKLYQCDARYFYVKNQNITFKELEFLIGHGNVRNLRFRNVNIVDENEEAVAIEDILKMTPKLTSLSISPTIFTDETKLSLIPFENKLYNSEFLGATGKLDPYDLSDFIDKYASFEVTVEMAAHFTEEEVSAFRESCVQILKNETFNTIEKKRLHAIKISIMRANP